ncbi:MAG: phospho-N-acetylmuramoyl-pentapeptide-transferase [Elusimicrobia bacterium]|nr:phospho-N-acetylmuramoyl-pentapeptide-transferase [Elusimicrobiota bacterium]
MLYYLAALREYWSPLNVFQYITFRMGGATLTALGISLWMGPWLIDKLRTYKISQVQRSYGPPTHLIKAGTPTMGGLLIFISVVLSTLLWARWSDRFVWVLLWVIVSLAAVGIWDDYIKLVQKRPEGASSRLKLTVQVVVALSIAFYFSIAPPNARFSEVLNIPYLKERYLDLGVFYYVLAVLIIVGTSNAVNLTDGLDGLAAGNIIFCALAYGLFAYAAGHAKFSEYLRIIPVEGAGEISVILAALVGACLGFLWFNAYPAEVFMGDTSSLFLGGVIGTVALCVKQELLLPVVGGVFVLETLSVLLQMLSYRLRKGKRVFLMAPLHHHFELKGWAEPKVTVRFWIISIVLVLAALASLKIR